mmetsp:Transcript_2376/g.4317  ORF Transcript_2376/g.4317 Transcript_2376/m.4317 type:complete len:516 (-) Transcript_2376:67-1614(-)
MEKGGKASSYGGKKGAGASYKGAPSGYSNVPAAFSRPSVFASKGDAAGGRDSNGKGGKSYSSGKSSYGSDAGSYGADDRKGGSYGGSYGSSYESSPGKGSGGKSSVFKTLPQGDSWSQPSKGSAKGSSYDSYGKGAGMKREREDYGFGGQKGLQGGKSDKGGKGKDSGKGKGKAQQRIAAGETVYSGVVRSFNPEKKNGFIDCTALFQQGSSGVYVFQDVLERGTPGPSGPGDRVAFFCHWSAKGQPQASSPLIRLKVGLEDGGFALKGIFKAGKPGEFGFIDCADTKEFFGRDVYVNKDLAATLNPGYPVSFSAYLNRDGMPNAEEAVICDEYWEPIPADLTQLQEVDTGKGKGKGEEKGGGKGGMSGGGTVFAGGKGKSGAPPEPTGRVCSGMIKSFNEVNNYGFIECEEIKNEYSLDVFMHGKEFHGYQVGEWVYFEVAISTKGQPQALNLQKYDQGEPAPKRQRVSEAPTGNYSAGADAGYQPDQSYEQPASAEATPAEDESLSFADLVQG